jgi:hypothetical protein
MNNELHELYDYISTYDYQDVEEYQLMGILVRLNPDGSVNVAETDNFERWANSTYISLPIDKILDLDSFTRVFGSRDPSKE